MSRFSPSPSSSSSRSLSSAILAIVAVLSLGAGFAGWRLRPESSSNAESGDAEWCGAHSVPEAICVECGNFDAPSPKQYGWCRDHGVQECPLCHPELAQARETPQVTAADRDRADQALTFTRRAENNSRCTLHQRRIQLASADSLRRLGIGVVSVNRGPVAERIAAPGQVDYDPTRVARAAPRLPGVVWRVEKRIGDRVRRGDVLALVDAPEAGKAKSEFQQALVQHDLKQRTLANLKSVAHLTSGRSVAEAEAEFELARVRLLAAQQALANLGLTIAIDDARRLSSADLAERMRFLGIPEPLVRSIASRTRSSGLMAIVAPLSGQITESAAVTGEAAAASQPLFTVVDASRMRLTLRVRLEDAARLKVGLPVRFRHEGHDDGDDGALDWISPAVDEATRTVFARVRLENADGRHRANDFGSAQILIRQEPDALLVPADALHWEGDCHIVFVRDKDFDQPGAPKIFHVRKVRPGAKVATDAGPMTEIAAGVLPGEHVASANSGILGAELLKHHLGAG